MERGWRDITPNCPRCGSSNTKFCYYNNYSLTQPRYFCKGCRRYWTKGGSLRNVPVGGGCRKSRRSRSCSLRLASSTNNHHHPGLAASRNGAIFNHGDHIASSNHQIVHNSYGNHSENLNDIVNSTTSAMNNNAESPSIDLSAVYANFLNPKPETNDSVRVELPEVLHGSFENDPSIDQFSSIQDVSHLAPSAQVILQQEHTNIVDCTNDNPPLSRAMSLPQLSTSNDHNSTFVPEFSTPGHPRQEEITIQHELGLPPLPGESTSPRELHHQVPSPWGASSDHQHHMHVSLLQAPRMPEFEPDPQFSNFFMGNWSPLDLPGFETSSSSSKH